MGVSCVHVHVHWLSHVHVTFARARRGSHVRSHLPKFALACLSHTFAPSSSVPIATFVSSSFPFKFTLASSRLKPCCRRHADSPGRSPCRPRLFLLTNRTPDIERRRSLLPLPAVAPELTIHLLPSIRTPNALQHGFAGFSLAGLISQSLSSLFPPSSVRTACNILVSITSDSPINIPSLASTQPGGRGPLGLHLYSRLCPLQRPTD
jgi:hypothetical protein